MKKIELARQYCPTGSPSNALHKLNRYIRDVKGLSEALARHGYRPKDRTLTTRQAQVIYDFLGEP